ncbi:MAG: hypothetical protein HOC71_05510 [Candidatus Latescibacteria bacterium]|jgi:hypothetical protein|nr:hypothetical protein [Candidatus Latescibacterota bacterium]
MWTEILRTGCSLVFFVLLAVFIFVYVMSKQKERMVLIEKGVDITKLNAKKYGRYANLRNGILLIALAIGFILGYIVTSITTMNVFIAYATSLLLCEGIGFLIYYNLNKNPDS